MTRACLLIASDSQLAAEQAARNAGLEPRLQITKAQCARPLGPIRHEARALGIRLTAIHSSDWERESLPQLYELAALRLGLETCVLVGDGSAQVALSRPQLLMRTASLPFDAITGVSLVAAELLRLRRTPTRAPGAFKIGGDGDAVMAAWPFGAQAQVGGPVTHLAGILGAFQHCGLRVGLLSAAPPPPQLEACVDDVEIVQPLPPAARVTHEISAVSANRAARAAGERLLARLRPRLIYQRHDGFASYGADLADGAGIPLVLEWNKSEVWAHRHWHTQNPLKRMFNPVAERIERNVLRRAALIAAVSSHTAREAIELGAPSDRVLVLPNGVDIDAIDAAVADAGPPHRGPGAVVGWVGSFDPWHGADVLVRSLTLLPADVRVLMIGDGTQRPACQALARELGVDHRVQFTGSLPHREAVRRLAECDLLASPHVPMPQRPFFGSPTKIFEYMAIGRPIVASRLEQIGEILQDGRTAILVTPGDVDDLARGIRSVLELPDRGQSLGAHARAVAARQHTWEARVRVVLARLDGSDDKAGAGAVGSELPAVSG